MAFFYLGSVLAYLRGRDRGSRLLLYVASPSLFLLAALSKEVAVTLPFALILAEAVRAGRKGWRSAFAAQGVHWAILFLLALSFLAHSGYGRLLENCFEIRNASSNLFTQIHGVTYLLSRLVQPHALNIDPDLPVYPGWTPSLLPEALFLLLLLAAGAFAVRKRALAGFGIFWFFLLLAPTNSFVPRHDVANDRQLYLASWGLFLAAASGAEILGDRGWKRRVAAGAILAAVLLGGFTVSRNMVYRSEISLWEDTAAKSPGKARVHNNLGYAYERAGRFAEARESYLRALAIDPGHARARGNLDGLDQAFTRSSSGEP
jgi:tetratricopeptide (TPR) repeat protein